MWVVVLLAGLAATTFALRDRIRPAVLDLAAAVDHAPTVELITVAETPPPEPGPVLTATGKIVSDHTVSVATKVSGQIVDLLFEQGDEVEQGQLLARIEDVLYRARRDEAAARVERSRAHLNFQRTNFARVEHLLETNSAPSIEYADAKRALEEAEAQLAADLATLAFAQKTLNDCEVVAPISGVILQRAVEVGDFVAAEGGIGANANARFAVIADMSKLRVEVDISELDIARLRKDMPCVIVPDAYKDRRYEGHVLWIDPGANYAKATVQVKVRILDPDAFLRVDGSAQVTFYAEPPRKRGTAQRASAGAATAGAPGIWIPVSALKQESEEAATVLVAADGRLRSRTVRLGARKGERVEVVEGLTPGESIAAGSIDRLADGQRIAASP